MDNNFFIYKKFTKKFKSTIIGPLDFSINKSEVTAILGSSGSGKSVVLNSMIGIIKSYKGKIIIDNIDISKKKGFMVNDKISFYTQMEFSTYNISVYRFLKIILGSFGIKKNEIDKEIEYWLKYFELWKDKDKEIRKFSWGMKNRLNLILCFVKRSEIIIMDEPGANLDSYWRNKIKNLLVKYKSEGKTIIITVHNIDEIASIIDNYIILESGKKIFEGSKQELDIYSKYKIYFSELFNEAQFRNFLKLKKIKSFKYDSEENSLTVAIDSYKDINFIFLYLIKNNLPLKNLIKLPLNMESIHKALKNAEKDHNSIVIEEDIRYEK